MAQENDNEDAGDTPGKPLPASDAPAGRGCGWAILRLLPLLVMAVSLAFPWLSEIRPQPGLIAVALLALPTFGLSCLLYAAVFLLGGALAVIQAFARPAAIPRGRKVLSILYLIALALGGLLAVALVAFSGEAGLSSSWGALVFAFGAAAAFVLELVAMRKA